MSTGSETSSDGSRIQGSTPASRRAHGDVKGITRNDAELVRLTQTEGWTDKNDKRYRELYNKARERENKRLNMMPTKLKNEAEEKAVASFQRWGFEELNENLREGKPLTAEQKKTQTQIDKIIARTTLKKDVVVYRGTRNAPKSNKGYASTSTRVTIGVKFSADKNGSKHLYAYRIPKGTHALVLGGYEDEIVLPRNFDLSKYRIL